MAHNTYNEAIANCGILKYAEKLTLWTLVTISVGNTCYCLWTSSIFSKLIVAMIGAKTRLHQIFTCTDRDKMCQWLVIFFCICSALFHGTNKSFRVKKYWSCLLSDSIQFQYMEDSYLFPHIILCIWTEPKELY